MRCLTCDPRGLRRSPAVVLVAVALVAFAFHAFALLVPGVAAAAGDPLAPDQWHLRQVGAPDAWRAGQGDGVVVAVIDTGVQLDHPDLQGRLVPGRDFIEPGTPPDDENGHGTLVAGVVVATLGNDRGGAGVAPRAKVMPVRVLDGEGNGTSRDVAGGLRWAADNGADVINLSLTEAPGSGGIDLITTEVEFAIREVSLQGVLVVGAAGNEGRVSTPYRSGVPVFVVGATDRADTVWRFSNRDPETIFAPGVEIISTYTGGGYASADGTSFAAPIVAAGAALLIEQGLDARQARQRLTETTTDVGAGVGRVDVAAAAQQAPPARPTDPPSARPADPPPERFSEPPGQSPEPPAAPAPQPDSSSTQPPGSETQPSPEPTRETSPTPGSGQAAAPEATASRSELPPSPSEPVLTPVPLSGGGAPSQATPTPTETTTPMTALPSKPQAAPDVVAADRAAQDRVNGWPAGVAGLLLIANIIAHVAVATHRRS